MPKIQQRKSVAHVSHRIFTVQLDGNGCYEFVESQLKNMRRAVHSLENSFVFQQFADEHDMRFVETSAKSCENVEEVSS